MTERIDESSPPGPIGTETLQEDQYTRTTRKVSIEDNGGWSDIITTEKKPFKIPLVIVVGGKTEPEDWII